MAPIRILHASDLHISTTKRMQSVIDTLKDLDKWDWSFENRRRMEADIKALWKTFRDKTAVSSSYDRDILRAFAEFAYKNAKRFDEAGNVTRGDIDAVLLTGDLATTGSKDDIGKTLAFLRGPASRAPRFLMDDGSPTLSALQVPVKYLPGNHDRFVFTDETAWTVLYEIEMPKFYDVGGREFDEKIRNFWNDPVQPMNKILMPLSTGRTLAVHIILADMTLRRFSDHDGRWFGWIGQGRAYHGRENDGVPGFQAETNPVFGNREAVLSTLVAETERLKAQSISANEVPCVIWACHFPPWFPGVAANSRLISSHHFVKAANNAGIKAVIAGHTHEHLQYRRSGMNFDVFCCGTTAQHEPAVSPGRRLEHDESKGNFFQIIKVGEQGAGEVKVSAESYRYTHPTGGGSTDNGSWLPMDLAAVRYAGPVLPWRRV